MPNHLAAALAVFALTGCSSPEQVAERTGVEAPATSGASASASSSSAAGKAVAEDNDTYSYELKYPAAVARIPELAAKIDADARRAKDEMVAEAKAAKVDSAKDGFPFNPHSLGQDWKVVADIPGYLSLSNEFYTYTGGAHGMYGLEGLVWDKAKKRALAANELFHSADFLGSTIGDALCDALNAERRKKGMDLPAGDDPIFPKCPSLTEATVLVGSSNGKTFDRITVWYGPYVAGSYAEGAYELDFPMTQAMLEAVKPAYRTAFSAKR